MPSPLRIALVQDLDGVLASALTGLTAPSRVAEFSTVAGGFAELADFEPDILLHGGPDDAEEIGAVRVLQRALPSCAVVLVATRQRELEHAAIAERIGARLLVAPFVTADLADLIASLRSSPELPPLHAFADLLRGIADEINNPLLAAGGHLQLAECLLDPAGDADALGQLAAARAALARIGGSLGRIAVLSRARSLAHPLRVVDLARLVRRNAKRLRAAGHALKTSSTAGAVRGDEALLDLAVAALLDTALALAGTARVIVRLRLADDTVQLEVRVPREVRVDWRLPESFLPYHVARVLRGTPHGLALFAVQAIAHAHGGAAEASRTKGGDLALVLRLRAATTPAPRRRRRN